MSGKWSNIPMVIFTQVAWIAFQFGVLAASGTAIGYAAMALGFEPSYSDGPKFWMACFGAATFLVLIPVMVAINEIREGDEMAKEFLDEYLKSARIEPEPLEFPDDGLTPLSRDSGLSFLEDIRRDRLP